MKTRSNLRNRKIRRRRKRGGLSGDAVRMITRKSFRYAGRSMLAGTEFAAKSERDRKVLTAVGLAIEAPTGDEQQQQQPQQEAPQPRVKRRYRRRDMAAE